MRLESNGLHWSSQRRGVTTIKLGKCCQSANKGNNILPLVTLVNLMMLSV